MAEQSEINYTIKELFQKLEDKVDRIFGVLNNKADHADLVALNTRVSSHDSRLTELERVNISQKERIEYRRWLYPVLIALLSIGATVAVTLLTMRK